VRYAAKEEAGGFADVYKAMHNNTPVVLKRLRVYHAQESASHWDQVRVIYVTPRSYSLTWLGPNIYRASDTKP
jgi:hypothetical protein